MERFEGLGEAAEVEAMGCKVEVKVVDVGPGVLESEMESKSCFPLSKPVSV